VSAGGVVSAGGATSASARSLRGWYLYDWANSAFATVILAALLPVYFADAVVPAGGARLFGTMLSATSLWGYASGFSALLVFLSAPLLGALADASRARRRWLLGCFLPGALATSLLFTVGSGDVGLALGLYVTAATLFIAANIFYDSFLPTLGPSSAQDAISARGFAWGYAGGGLIFLADLVLIQMHGSFGLSKQWAVRLALSSAGLWWGGFGLAAWRMLEEPPGPAARRVTPLGATRETWATFRSVLARPALAIFCLAFLFINDGVQTVVKMASIYGKDELHLGMGTLLGTLLLVQIIGVPGALLFGRLAGRIGTRGALMLSLVIWLAVVLWAWRLTAAWEFWMLGAAVGFCLGATQSLSRSFFAHFVPPAHSAQYFGFYSVFGKFSAIGGPLLFGLIRQLSGTARLSILALGAFFLLGLVLLAVMPRDPALTGQAERPTL
jgi:MFS transporter, UMF1 family